MRKIGLILEILRFDVYPTTQTELKIYHFDKNDNLPGNPMV